MADVATTRYFCHQCNVNIDRVTEDFCCPTCNLGFIGLCQQKLNLSALCYSLQGCISCSPPTPGGDRIKLLGKKIKWGRRESKGKGEGEGKRGTEEGSKGREWKEKGKGRQEGTEGRRKREGEGKRPSS